MPTIALAALDDVTVGFLDVEGPDLDDPPRQRPCRLRAAPLDAEHQNDPVLRSIEPWLGDAGDALVDARSGRIRIEVAIASNTQLIVEIPNDSMRGGRFWITTDNASGPAGMAWQAPPAL